MAKQNILLVGCGDIGIPLGQQLTEQGFQVWGLRRSGQLPAPINTINADVTRAETLTSLAELSFDYVVVTLTPAAFNDEGYRIVYVAGMTNLLRALSGQPRLKRLLFVSSTSVYHQDDGQWVDEDSVTLPQSFSGKRLLEAEQLLAESNIAVTVVRFAGIYGPGRRRLIEQVKARQGCAQTPALFTNRIHRDDCVGILAYLITLDCGGEQLADCYIGVDNEPVTMWQLKNWLALQLKIAPEELIEQVLTRRNSKRCSNRRLLATGYQLQYPGYQQGYGALLAAS